MNTLAEVLKSPSLVRVLNEFFRDNTREDRVIYIDFATKNKIVIERAHFESEVRNG